MELVYFSAQTMPRKSGGNKHSRITFSKAGAIVLNESAGKLIGLTGGGKITIAQDKNEPENWYIFLDENGFALRGKGDDKKGYAFNHVELVKAFIEAIGKDINESHSFLIAGQPTILKGSKTQYWGILVR